MQGIVNSNITYSYYYETSYVNIEFKNYAFPRIPSAMIIYICVICMLLVTSLLRFQIEIVPMQNIK